MSQKPGHAHDASYPSVYIGEWMDTIELVVI